MSSTHLGPVAEFGEENIPLKKVVPKYFGLSCEGAGQRISAKMLMWMLFVLGKHPVGAFLFRCVAARLSGMDHRRPEWPKGALLDEGMR